MAYDTSNIFARLLRGEVSCNKVLEDPYGLAFHDLHPKAPIHILVIPKGDYINALDFYANAADEEVVGFSRFLSKVLKAVGVADKGYRLIANHGLYGGQEVPHYHLHLLGGTPLGAMVFKG